MRARREPDGRIRPPLAVAAMASFLLGFAWPGNAADVRLVRVPDGGIQPQAALGGDGTLHLLYYRGEPARGDLHYVRSTDGGATFSSPIRVNSRPETAIAAGTIRGGKMALGQGGRVHVLWNGATGAEPRGVLDPDRPADDPHNGTPILYARLDDAASGFEPQRNLARRTFGLDGGGSIAADRKGNAYAVWHAREAGSPLGEIGRGVWVAISRDGGRTFAEEIPAGPHKDGACGCCGLEAFADAGGAVYVLYRTARELEHRDIHLLVSLDEGRRFREALVDAWNVAACPMSSMSFAGGPGAVLGAWQTGEQVYYAALDPAAPDAIEAIPATGDPSRRKYPVLARGADGRTLLLWAEGAGWKTSGRLAWQVFDAAGAPEGPREAGPALPDWSFGAVVPRPDGGFTVVY